MWKCKWNENENELVNENEDLLSNEKVVVDDIFSIF